MAKIVLDDNNLTHHNAHDYQDKMAALLHAELSSFSDALPSKVERAARNLHLTNRFIAARLTRCLALETLSLKGSNVTDALVEQLVEALELHKMALVKLRLGNNDIKCEGAAKLARFLNNDTHLRQLDLSYNDIADAGATALGNCLQHNASLLELNLKENQISDTSAFVCSHLFGHFFRHAARHLLFLFENDSARSTL